VVAAVLAATIAELARVGFGALSVEEVADRAGVNKTTVYRRWPTKVDLVRAALLQLTVETFPPPDTGSLRSDLIVVLRQAAAFFARAEGQGIVRSALAEGQDPMLMRISKSIRERNDLRTEMVVERAIGRGEVPAGTDAHAVVGLLLGDILRRLVLDNEPVDEGYFERTVDLVLNGALHGGGLPRVGVRHGRRPSDSGARKRGVDA
jgi:AcrR family transcriptional regulator